MRVLAIVVLVGACRGSAPIAREASPQLAVTHDANVTTQDAPAAQPREAAPIQTRGRTALHDAAQAGEVDKVRALIDGGADLEAIEDVYGFTPFLLALEYSEPEAAMVLLERGAKADGRGLAMAARGGSIDVIEALLKRGVSVKGTFALHAAAKYGHAKAIERLLKAGALVDEVEPDDRWTPLLIACMENQLEVAKVLIRAGANVNVKDDDGNTPLHWAVFGARPNEIHEYEELGKPHDTYWVPQKDAPLVELIIKNGAAVDALDGDGDTALHRAAMYDAASAVKVLLAGKANRRLTNRDGKTALSLATDRNHETIIRLLKKP